MRTFTIEIDETQARLTIDGLEKVLHELGGLCENAHINGLKTVAEEMNNLTFRASMLQEDIYGKLNKKEAKA